MALGEPYLRLWKELCEANWLEYGARHGYDIICIDRLLDDSKRALARHLSWQKCLILGNEAVNNYDQVVWVDSDILINNQIAPDISKDVPLPKIGVVEIFSEPTPAWYRECLTRMYDFWGNNAVINYDPRDYYKSYGFPASFDKVAMNGVIVLSPRHHRELMERNYYNYEERGSCWNGEMRPFSYELLNAGCEHWLDCRFNINWWEVRFMHYPWLVNPRAHRRFSVRLADKLAELLGGDFRSRLRRACVNATFLTSFFMHFGGDTKEDMRLVDQPESSWRHCRM